MQHSFSLYTLGTINSRSHIICSIKIYGRVFHPILGAIPQLNYITSTSSDPVWLDNVRCIGNETHLLNCTHSTIGVVSSYCRSSFGYYYAAGVHCLGTVLYVDNMGADTIFNLGGGVAVRRLMMMMYIVLENVVCVWGGAPKASPPPLPKCLHA